VGLLCQHFLTFKQVRKERQHGPAHVTVLLWVPTLWEGIHAHFGEGLLVR
jgi:hypothetical protein